MPINLPSIRDIDVKGKRVLLRVDFNVLFSDGEDGGFVQNYQDHSHY